MNLSQQEDGWYFGTESSPTNGRNVLPPKEHQFRPFGPVNALGLQGMIGSSASLVPATAPTASANVAYHPAASHPSRFIQALTDDTVLAGQAASRFQPTYEATPNQIMEELPHPIELSPQPPQSYLLRPISRSSSSMESLSSVSVDQVRPMPPRSSAPPQLSLRLPPLSQEEQMRLRLEGVNGHSEKSPQRKRLRRRSPEISEQSLGDTQPSMLLVPLHTAPTSVPPASRRLANVRPVISNDNHDIDPEHAMPTETSEDQVIQSLYEESPRGEVVDLRRLYGLVHKLLEAQTNLARNIEQIDSRTQALIVTNATRPSNGGGTHVSPPEPPEPINWDQSVPYDAPAGRHRRVKRRVLLMGLIRETIFKMLSRRSVHDPLPPPPPPALRVPTIANFAIRWEESSKDVFNQLAANIVAQKITIDQPKMLTEDEVKELPSMVTSHIKYLCRCYKDQNRDDAEDFNALRLKRCGTGTRKRQLYATRLQVIDKFPEHLGKHRRLLVHLGVDGTSSDEEDPKGSGIYKIKNKPQLSSKVTLLKRDLDHVYQLYYKGPGTKGSQVHRRVPSNTDSTRPFLVQGLPLSCISRAWLQQLDSAEKEFYEFTPHNYDFSFPMSLLNVRGPGWPIGERPRNVSP